MSVDGAPVALPGDVLPNVRVRVNQILSACSFCKGRKVKCDGGPPACARCKAYGRGATCSLQQEGSGSQRDYVAYLRSRIHQLQDALDNDDAGCVTQGGHAHQDDLQAAVPSSDREHAQEAGIPERPSNDSQTRQTGIDQMVADLGALPIIASSYDAVPVDGLSLATIVLSAASAVAGLPPLIHAHECAQTFALLPDLQLARSLARHYFECVYPRLPFFLRDGFWSQLGAAYEDGASEQHQDEGSTVAPNCTEQRFPNAATRGEGLEGTLKHGYAFFTVLMVCAVSTAALSKSADSVLSHKADLLLQSALRFREYAILPNSIMGLQAILFLLQYSTLIPSRLDSWYLAGIGMRICVDLGLHQDRHGATNIRAGMLETRRRLFWSMYSFDRSISIGTGRPCEISDSVIDVDIPHFFSGWEVSDEEVKGYRQRYVVLRLQSLIYEMLYMGDFDLEDAHSIVCKFRANIDEWTNQNPDTLSEHSQRLMETERLQSLILLYRPCPGIRTRTAGDLQQLHTASLRFVRIYRSLAERNELFYVQVALEKSYTAGIAMLYAEWHLCRAHNAHRESVDASVWNPMDIWNGIADVNFLLRALAPRAIAGEAVASKYEHLSGEVFHLLRTRPQAYMGMDADPPGVDIGALPKEVNDFWQHSGSIRVDATTANGFQPVDDLRSELQEELISGFAKRA